MTAPSSNSASGSPFAWAAYLGASWTWCIGMWLPVFLLRDLGPWSFAIFAIPNCVGAAAMGWVLPTPESSLRLTTHHAVACRLFSAVTYLFQCYFLAAIAFGGDGSPWQGLAAVLAFLVPIRAAKAISGRHHRQRLVAIATLVASASIGLWFVMKHGSTLTLPHAASPSAVELLGLASVCLLGFALCPYLDLTFHRARRSLPTPAASRVGFGVGFCLLFASMILLTFGYGLLLIGVQVPPNFGPWLLPLPLLIHICLQIALKLILHFEETEATLSAAERPKALVLPLLGGMVALAFVLTRHTGPWFFGLTTFELGYRAFMSFYGLVFPSYVWLCMLPLHAAPETPKARAVITWLLTMLAASPFYWIGFMERRYEWTIGGVAMVLLARLFVPRPSAQRSPSA